MKLKVGDQVEFAATVKGIFPQDDDLLVALELDAGGRVSLHDRWILRTEGGPLSEGEDVLISGKVTLVRGSSRGDVVSLRIDGSTVTVTRLADLLRKVPARR